MTRDTERMVTWAILGLIAWELWPKQTQQQVGFQANRDSQTPTWLQQLSYLELNDGTTDPMDDLLAIPQGPGGLPNAITSNYFNPAEGYGALCTPQPAPAGGPSSQVFASPMAQPGAFSVEPYTNPFGIYAGTYNMVDIQNLGQ